MATQLDKKLVNKISTCYSAIGFEEPRMPDQVSFFNCPYWRNSILSPVLLKGQNFNSGLLIEIERYFKNNLFKSRFCSNEPYLQFFEDGYFKLEKMRKTWVKNGWEEAEQKDVINVWLNPVPLVVPKGIHFKVGRYFDPHLNKDFLKIMRKNFGRSNDLETGLFKLHKKINDRLLVVVIYNSKSQPIASGLVATNGSANYLYCGSVIKEARKKGIWKLLVAVRQ